MHCNCHLSVLIDTSKIKLSLFDIGSLLYRNVCRVLLWLELAKANTFHVVQYIYEDVTSLLAFSEEVCRAVML